MSPVPGFYKQVAKNHVYQLEVNILKFPPFKQQVLSLGKEKLV